MTTEDMLLNKPVGSRKNRPEWAMDDRKLMLKCVDPDSQRRFTIAQMYWQKNMTTADIAAYIGTTRNAVKMVIKKLMVSQGTPFQKRSVGHEAATEL